MNGRQKCILILGLVIFMAMALFPPVERAWPGGAVGTTGTPEGSFKAVGPHSEFIGYRYYYSVPELRSPGGGLGDLQIAKDVFFIQFICLAIVVLGLMRTFRNSKLSLLRGRLYQPNQYLTYG